MIILFQVDLVRSITDKKSYLSAGVKKILETISTFDNIPRKKPKFMNFMKNSFRYMKVNELEEAWTLLEEAMQESKSENQNGKANGSAVKEAVNGAVNGSSNGNQDAAINGTSNGNQEAVNGSKRKLEQEIAEEPGKKKKKPESEDDLKDPSEKFSWGETIRNILLSKNNELKLKKLRVKIKNKYQNLTGTEWNDKIEKKFNKKINKLKGVVVEDEKIRLIE
jgi:cell growth-regulating nucleolar protein